MAYSLLTDRTLISLSGKDTVDFLQGLITNDMAKLGAQTPLYAAMLTPQGKFLHDFFVIYAGDGVLLDVNSARAADLVKRLTLYKLRSDVTISLHADMRVSAGWDDLPAINADYTIDDPRHVSLGKRFYAKKLPEAADGDYEAHRIVLGIPDGAKDMIVDKSFLAEFWFEALHGVSFSKGCYVGQELVARSKFRGQVHKCLYQVESRDILPAIGTKIMAGDKEAGELRSVSGGQGLAIIRKEYVEAETMLTADGTLLKPRLPKWAEALVE